MEHEAELFAAIACSEVRGTNGFLQHFRYSNKNFIARQVAVGIVVLLEFIDVDHHHADGSQHLERTLQAQSQRLAVVQACQCVARGGVYKARELELVDECRARKSAFDVRKVVEGCHSNPRTASEVRRQMISVAQNADPYIVSSVGGESLMSKDKEQVTVVAGSVNGPQLATYI